MVLLFSCLIIGLSALGVSFYYSILWFYNQGAGLFLSVVFALIYVGSTTIAFEKGIEQLNIFANVEKGKTYKRKKRWTYLLSGLLILGLWSMGAGYSMLSTIGGQYDQLVTLDTKTTEQIDRTDYVAIQAQKLEDRASYKAEERALVLACAELPPGTDWASREAINRNQGRLDTVRAELKTIDAYLLEIAPLVGAQEHTETFNISDRNFYVYLAEITGKDPVKIQFKLALFPSVTTDIISPVFITIFILGWRRENRLKKERLRRPTAPKKNVAAQREPTKKTISMARKKPAAQQAELFE